MGIERLDPRNRHDVEAVASLHTEYLGDSPVVQLGQRFLTRFYYDTLIRDDLLQCSICRADGRVVGFISYTKDPSDLFSKGVRRHVVRLAWLMGTGIMRRPRLAVDILKALRLMRGRQGEARPTHPTGVGEVASLVADKDYRTYVPPGGSTRMTARLVDHMVEYYRAHDIKIFQFMVLPENKASNLFCTMMGCTLERTRISGRPVHRYLYHIDRKDDVVESGP